MSSSTTPERGKEPVHLVKSRYNGQDYDVWTACGLGDGSDRGFKNFTTDMNLITCKRCLKAKAIQPNFRSIQKQFSRRLKISNTNE